MLQLPHIWIYVCCVPSASYRIGTRVWGLRSWRPRRGAFESDFCRAYDAIECAICKVAFFYCAVFAHQTDVVLSVHALLVQRRAEVSVWLRSLVFSLTLGRISHFRDAIEFQILQSCCLVNIPTIVLSRHSCRPYNAPRSEQCALRAELIIEQSAVQRCCASDRCT